MYIKMLLVLSHSLEIKSMHKNEYSLKFNQVVDVQDT